MTIGEKLKKMRIMLNLRISEISKTSTLSVDTIRSIEEGISDSKDVETYKQLIGTEFQKQGIKIDIRNLDKIDVD